MKHIFWDTNVILDLIDPDRSGHGDALQLKEDMKRAEALGLCAWHSLSILDYIGAKKFGQDEILVILQEFVHEFVIPKTGSEKAKIAFQYLNEDFEDAMQIAAAVAGQADCLVTRDKTGFIHCPIPVLSPTECGKHLKKIPRS